MKYFVAALSGLFLTMVVISACETAPHDSRAAEDSINRHELEKHVFALASDEFEGRKPFTAGEDKTLAYLKAQFEKMGLVGANNGSYYQDVPLVEIATTPSRWMQVDSKNALIQLEYLEEFIASTSRITEEISIDGSEMVFAGYGIVAPEYGWDDYRGFDAAGKTVVVLVNDPGFATQDESMFRGNAMTYYGRWTYKYEEAARQGAAGIMVVHRTDAAGYPWSVLRNGAAGADLVLQSEDNNMNRCALEGWFTTEAARKIFDKAGLDFDALATEAADPSFAAVPLEARASLVLHNQLKYETSKNVLALLPGRDRADECVVYTAHWDHLGVGPVIDGDSIYNGAADNALPVACMLETARAFTRLADRPSRSVLFIAVTAEETGLLGSAYYVDHPLFPMEKTVANLNYELFLPLGRMRDVTVYGYGMSELEDYVKAAAEAQDRYVTPEPFPENGMYYRTDHFSFAKAGVPALFIKGWSDHRLHGREWTTNQIQDFWANHYHQPSDEYEPVSADLNGIVEDAKLFFKIGCQLSNTDDFPRWHDGSEFKKIREKSQNKTGK